MTKPYKESDIIKLHEFESIELLLEIKKNTRDVSLEDSRDCREFAEWMKTFFVEEYTEEEEAEFK